MGEHADDHIDAMLSDLCDNGGWGRRRHNPFLQPRRKKMPAPETYLKFDVNVIAVTEKAVLADFEDHQIQEWIPRSCCRNGHHEFLKGEPAELHIAQWKAEQIGVA